MSDNNKLKERLGFLSLYSYIVGLTLLTESTRLFDIAAHLQLPILGFGTDRASAEFNVQNQLMQVETCKRLIFKDKLY
ncbi:6542_t:CDS:2, partial [Scutellospora calospora]